MVAVRPFLRWAGSKRQVVPLLAEHWKEANSRYIEPFAGSAALFFHLSPTRAILGDQNPHLVQALTAVRDDPSGVSRVLARWPNHAEQYYRLRRRDPALLSECGRAARFIYLNRFCFNGLYRTNKKGHFNVPYGGASSGARPGLEELKECSRRLSKASIRQADFEATALLAKPGDLVYMDPPYSLKRPTYGEYGPDEFSHKDLKRLRRIMEELDSKKVDILVSYADNELGQSLGSGFLVDRIPVRRNISGFAGARKRAHEVLIYNRSLPS